MLHERIDLDQVLATFQHRAGRENIQLQLGTIGEPSIKPRRRDGRRIITGRIRPDDGPHRGAIHHALHSRCPRANRTFQFCIEQGKRGNQNQHGIQVQGSTHPIIIGVTDGELNGIRPGLVELMRHIVRTVHHQSVSITKDPRPVFNAVPRIHRAAQIFEGNFVSHTNRSRWNVVHQIRGSLNAPCRNNVGARRSALNASFPTRKTSSVVRRRNQLERQTSGRVVHRRGNLKPLQLRACITAQRCCPRVVPVENQQIIAVVGVRAREDVEGQKIDADEVRRIVRANGESELRTCICRIVSIVPENALARIDCAICHGE